MLFGGGGNLMKAGCANLFASPLFKAYMGSRHCTAATVL